MANELIPLEHQTQVSDFSFAGIVALWNSMPESKHWGPVDYVYGLSGKPSLVILGSSKEHGGELYAVLDVFDCRVLSEEEFPSSETWEIEQIPGGPNIPQRKKTKKQRKAEARARH